MRRGLPIFVGFLALASLAIAARGPLIIAHRGNPDKFPENTLPGLQSGAAVADAIKLDVHETKDGELVIIHDDTLNRTTDKTGAVRNLTLAKIREADAGIKAGQKFQGLRVPTLAEALEVIPPDKIIIFGWKEGKLDTLLNFLRAHSLVNRIYLESGDADFLRVAKEAEPKLKVVLFSWHHYAPEFLELARKISSSAIVLRWNAVSTTDIKKIKRSSVSLWLYTVNDLSQARKLSLAGASGIFTDRPDLFVAGRHVLTSN